MNYKWSDRIDNNTLYGTSRKHKNKLRFVSERLRERRLTFLGHCWRSRNPETGAPQLISDVMFWKCPGTLKVGRPADNFLSVLAHDIKIDKENVKTIQSLMDDRVDWILKVKPHLSRKQVKNAVSNKNKKPTAGKKEKRKRKEDDKERKKRKI